MDNQNNIINGLLTSATKAAWIKENAKNPLLVITSHTKDASEIAQYLSADLFSAPDTIPGEEFPPEKELIAERIRILSNIPDIIVAPIKAVMWKTLSKAEIQKSKSKIQINHEYKIEELVEKLVKFGYKRQEIVGERGEFAVRGGIVDIFHCEPVRIEFFGDKVESIRVFDAQTQRSINKIESYNLLPIVENGNSSFFEHINSETIVFLDEPMQLKAVAEQEGYFRYEDLVAQTNSFKTITNTSFEKGEKIDLSNLPKLPEPKQKKKTVQEGINRSLLLELKDGDHVVHENYGIGLYRGMHKMEIDDVEQEYLLLEYAKGDQLYVPLQQMGLVEKYSGNPSPYLYRLHGKEWKKTKSKVKKGLQDLTQELLLLYAIRNKTTGYAFPKDMQTQNELAATFPFEETKDQDKAIKDVMRDMESDRPMDRLVCGDVGYGKTEVAIRSAFKAATSGKQVAVLSPTTILAQQHYATFCERLKNYPINIEVLSRFKHKNEQKKIVEKIPTGEIDILIGTHRLLSKDIIFKDLGLLIVDEEQRFGVTHKEKLKQLRKNVDVMTLTATPIPRTLYFSLSGARDMSLINTAPVDRLPIRTHVVSWNEELIKEVILRELDRGGQVYFVHNRVQTIDTVARKIRKLIPDVRIAIGHGQMQEDKLAKIMTEFQEKKYDVLICTTIIESGLDITNVNTMIIDHAERFGLAQLYQLRGRVGRSSNRAYAYLLYHKEEVLKEEAVKRLKAIQEFTELGSGYRLALRDLEIRGSGTLLGARQSGHIISVGFDMYCDMLEEAVKKAKGIEEPLARQVVVDLKVSAFIPSDYINDERQRVATYRRLTLLDSKQKLNEMRDEMKDRYGEIPRPFKQLFEIVDIKIRAQLKGIKLIKEEKNRIVIEWFDGRDKKIKYHSGLNALKLVRSLL